MKQVRIHGRGGQGVVTAAELIAIAAFNDGKEAQAFPSFGVERTGAPIEAFARISDKPIRTREHVYNPDVLIIQDATLLSTVDVGHGSDEHTFVIINTAKTKKELKLKPIDPELAKTGETIFESKCATCHKLDERYTGPAQRDVLQRVTPEFFLNMVLNPEENLEKHPHSKKMFLEYLQKMTNQNINIKDALALLEYFRVLDEELTKSNSNQH